MPDVQNVALGKPKIGGAIFRAPLGTTLPTNASTALPAAFIEQGYVSDEGVARAISRSYSALKAWGGDEVANSKTEETIRLTFALIEASNVETLTSKYGAAAVTEADDLITIDYKGEETEPSVWVVDMEYNGKLRRLVFGNAKDTTEDFTQTFADEDLIEVPFELSVMKDGNGSFFKDFIEAAS